jgi:CheY-like chemotaxis protein
MADEGSRPQGLPVVLVVDDEPVQLQVLSHELGKVCELHTATTAAEAGRSVEARRFDVIVCDHMLPGEQGLDFLIRMMRLAPSTRRIMMTGYTNAEFISRSTIIAGLSCCLVKPVEPAEVASAIMAALAP